MEHIFHIFGGGCGEHMLLPSLTGIGLTLAVARNYIIHQFRRVFRAQDDKPSA